MSGETEKPEKGGKHRLFAACPIPPQVSRKLHDWALDGLAGAPVRLVRPENLHVTLFFFGEVDSATKDELEALMREVNWSPISVQSEKLAARGHSALALDLIASTDAHKGLEEKLCRTSHGLRSPMTEEQARVWYEMSLRTPDPLEKLEERVTLAEQERVRRSRSHRRPLELHVTLARSKARLPTETKYQAPPKMFFTLDRLALYESFLEPGGSRYELIAEAKMAG